MSKKIKLILMAVTLLFSALAAWGATVHFAPDNTPGKMKQGELIFSLTGCKSLSWQHKDGQKISFDISGPDWVLEADPTYQLSQLYRSDIENQLNQLHARKVITDPGALSQYGLAEPLVTIWADSTTIVIGDATAVGGLRYLSVVDTDKVYLVTDSTLFPFAHSLEEMIQLPKLPELNNSLALSATLGDRTLMLTLSETGLWCLNGAPLDEALSQQLQTAINRLRLSDCADAFPTDPAEYGMHTLCVFTLADGSALELTLGSANQDEMYASIGDGRIYCVSTTLYDTLLTLQ